jgi:hypothetical protein
VDNLKIFSEATLQRLKSPLMDGHKIPEIYGSKRKPETSGFEFLNTTISVSDDTPDLIVGGGSQSRHDADNAVIIYDYLGQLSRTQASDSRLWVTLTHTKFWKYTHARWPISGKNTHILEHWFESKKGGLAALRRNSISRLWWAAHLAMAPWEHDPTLGIFKTSNRYKYIEILLSQQQIYFDIIERSYGSNLQLRICLLDAFSEFLPKVTNKDDLSKDVSKKVRLLLKHRQVDAINIVELKAIIFEIVKNSANRILDKKLAR